MIEVGTRRRNLPAPPHIVFQALTEPHRDPVRPWLLLLDDETPPVLLALQKPSLVLWSSLWTKAPDARIRFDLPSDGASGTDLRWTLMVPEPAPDNARLGHFRKRINQLINANLRYGFGQ